MDAGAVPGAIHRACTFALIRRDESALCEDGAGVRVCVLYYKIAPQLWASRERRIKQVRRFVNRVACILPFEEEYYRVRGVEATFVGHPLFDELPAGRRMAEGREFGE